MLSEDERSRLDDIENGLESSDPELSAALAGLPGPSSQRRLRYARALVVVGILLVVVGVVLGVDPALMEGLVLVLGGGWWWAWLWPPARTDHSSPR
jgi:hypothetical protein